MKVGADLETHIQNFGNLESREGEGACPDICEVLECHMFPSKFIKV